MYQKVISPNSNPVLTPEQLASFGRFDLPEQYVANSSPQVQTADYTWIQTMIAAATDQVETIAQTACQSEQVLFTLDFFPNTQDPRNMLQYELSYSYAVTPWWWFGYPTKDSIELVRRPVQVPTLTGNAVNLTAVSVANNIVTVTCANSFSVSNVVVLANTAEGNIANPNLTPSTTPFLNGCPLTILTCSGTQFTASFPNLYQINSAGTAVAQSYTNNADTGTAQQISNPLTLTFNDQNGVLQIWNTTNYTVYANKITLTVGNWWPLTDRRQDCIQISYWAGSATAPAQNGLPANGVAPRLQMAVAYLANHMWQVRDIITVEPTSEVGRTLCTMLSSYRTYRVPR